ncbi:hypothetical protein FJZ53_07085 [Candidatus Woesearchaeota archaeon]|nr:hypothetical protein [Candidatus Woesearchaeota archaeon]
MKIPNSFVPEKDLEEKVKDLSNKKCKKSIPGPFTPPKLEELRERTNPIFEDCLKTIYGKRRYHFISLEGVPDNYQGWIDCIITNDYEGKTYYCRLFDSKTEEGIKLKNKFWDGYKGRRIFDFKSHETFSIKGELVKEGYNNDFWWFLLTVDEVYKKAP